MSDDPTVYTVKEIRLGLFRIYWDYSEKLLEIKDHISKKFDLCGSQLGRSVTISFQEYMHDIKVDVKAVEMQSKNVNRKWIDKNEPEQTPFQLNESPKSEESQTTVVESVMQPVKIWLESTVNGSPIEVSKLTKFDIEDCISCTEQECWEEYENSWRVFITVKCRYEEDNECSFVVWIDFGTSEVKQTNMINTIAEMLHNQTRCDVKFLFKDGQTIGAHILILSAASSLFATMFQSGFEESQTCVEVSDGIDLPVFKQLLDYLYTSKVPRITVNKEINIMSLYEAADKYDVKDLKKECYEMLMEVELDTENVIEILVWSKFHSVLDLFKKAMEFMVNNCRDLCSQPAWLDFMKKHPELCLEVNKEMADEVEEYYKYMYSNFWG